VRAPEGMIDALIPEVLEDRPMPFSAHLIELRERVIWSLAIVGAGALVAYQFSGEILSFLAKPAGQLVFIAPAEAFETRMKIGFYGGFVLTLPLVLHQVWLFVARALDASWRRTILSMLPAAYGLFLLGAGLCLWLVVPAAMRFFYSFGTDGVKPLISLGAYLSFVTTMSLAFGATFQLPLVLVILNRLGVVDRETLAERRRPMYFAAFVFSALLGPDVFTQFCLALSIALLFEIALLAMRRPRA
jgi:sec-independent protein translocase protein TatC